MIETCYAQTVVNGQVVPFVVLFVGDRCVWTNLTGAQLKGEEPIAGHNSPPHASRLAR